eukprot:TRINITY_DN52164_c0_g1_i1.p1 TRINITY_DN52164_c0_g1~~TRINITY_DN52164_c0_g1_i1.p1  ORF type:complete len:322 (+),score=13.18 TRINITY_DN52164_c0_g1_i1:124-1089(+)
MNDHGLSYMTLGSGMDRPTWYHESFHVFQQGTTPGIEYTGDTKWAIEATAEWYQHVKVHSDSETWSFYNTLLVSNTPHLALWHTYENGPPGEKHGWVHGVRSYGLCIMLYWLTHISVPPVFEERVIYDAFMQASLPLEYGLQEYLYLQGGNKYREGFVDWAAHTTNNTDYLTAAQIAEAQYNIDTYGAPEHFHPFAVVIDQLTVGNHTLVPDPALKPRGWGYNVLKLTNTPAGIYQFDLVGEERGSENASSNFVARLLVGKSSSAKVVAFDMDADGLHGSVNFTSETEGSEINIIVAAVPACFHSHQDYGYQVKVIIDALV